MKKNIFCFVLLAAAALSHASRAAGESVMPMASGLRAAVRLDGAWQTRANEGYEFHFPPGRDGWRPVEIPTRGGPFLESFSVYESDIRKLLDKQGRPIADKASAWYRRQFEIWGKRFYLNGRRVTLLRGSMLTPAGVDYAKVALGDPRTGGFRRTARQPCSTVRRHIGFVNR